ncbi:hypothetical protein SBRY_50687 [Actinacidiphila bryophytorum]|uniref:Uncharacterized protein n=1 Tax=Actinacidiphila bryophytorum TaxID=1436133 RepID=A0A9W4H4X2_9ACTN|nr:hypothetical protein SBRY_50687 [Actinacidiphila bryophytorum]
MASPGRPSAPGPPTGRFSGPAHRLRIVQDGRAGVARERGLLRGRDLPAEAVGRHVLQVVLDRRAGVQRLAQFRLVTHCGDPVGRRVDAALEDQGVADAADGAGGDQPLVHHPDALGAALPERVDHGLQVLLVDDQVVGLRVGDAGDEGGRVGRCVVEGDLDRGSGERVGARVPGQGVGPGLLRGTQPAALPGQPVDVLPDAGELVLQLAIAGVLGANGVGQLRQRVVAADVHALGGVETHPEDQSGQREDSRTEHSQRYGAGDSTGGGGGCASTAIRRHRTLSPYNQRKHYANGRPAAAAPLAGNGPPPPIRQTAPHIRRGYAAHRQETPSCRSHGSARRPTSPRPRRRPPPP